jgi:class 3 adenylate cyclase
MTTQDFKRKLTAILSADAEGYSRLMGEDEEATVRTITAYRKVISSVVQKHRGRVVDSPGDNILAEFASVVDAVSSAVEIQDELRIRNAGLPEDRRMEFRIGVNLGDVIDEEERIYGDGVNVAARVESLAEAGGICVSGTAFDQIEDKLPLGYEYLGEQSVKNIPKPVRVYKALMDPEAVGKVIVAKRVDPRRKHRAVFVVAVALLLVAGAALLWQLKMRTPTPASGVLNLEYLKEEIKKREEERRRLAEKRESLRVEEERLDADMKLYLEWMQRLEFEKKQSEEARAKLASMERERDAEYQQRLEAERRLQEERKRIEAERERLEKEKKQSEEARAKLASIEKEKNAEYQQRLETERRLQEERKRIEAERERLDNEQQKPAYVPKTVTSARISLRSEPKLYSDSDEYIEQMLKKYNFFENDRNAEGSFKNDFVDNGNGTITDRATGLMWEGGGSPSARIFKRSEFYVRNLNEDKFAGYSDWRLPTVEELASLLKKDDNNGFHIDPLFDTKQKSCWSSDKGPLISGFGNAPQVWHVIFGEGSLGLTVLYFKHYSGMSTTYRYVRAVRSIE